MTENPNLEIGDRPAVFLHRNNPNVPSRKCSQLTKDGVGIVDWGMGLSWDYTEAHEDRRDNAKKALETILTANEEGGYGVIHTEGYDDVVIGRVDPPCIRFIETPDTDGTDRVFKGFELEESESVDLRSEFPDLHERMVDRAAHGTTVPVQQNYTELVTDAFTQLDLDGRID